MIKKQKILDIISREKNKLIENLSDEEKKEADTYFEETVNEILPVLENLDKLLSDKKRLNIAAEAFKSEIKEQEWLEKLSKTFYDMSGSMS